MLSLITKTILLIVLVKKFLLVSVALKVFSVQNGILVLVGSCFWKVPVKIRSQMTLSSFFQKKSSIRGKKSEMT